MKIRITTEREFPDGAWVDYMAHARRCGLPDVDWDALRRDGICRMERRVQGCVERATYEIIEGDAPCA